jgi:hypothetical protein
VLLITKVLLLSALQTTLPTVSIQILGAFLNPSLLQLSKSAVFCNGNCLHGQFQNIKAVTGG